MSDRIIDVIIYNMKKLIEQHDDFVDDGSPIDVYGEWWIDEYGSDLTAFISCHPVFEGDEPCLCEVRDKDIGSREGRECCSECKAKWLFGKYE